jgi:phage protein U
MKRNYLKRNNGQILVQALVFGSIAVVIIGGLISWAAVNIKASRLAIYREQALQIAESGADYYRWHLAHAANDYKDGTTTPSPYVHNFYDKDDNLIGTFTLTITPPATGTTIVIVKSTGTLAIDSTISRSIQVKFAIPSLAKYAVVANDNLRFGAGTEVFGPLHSNGGIRFDGLAHNIITSAQASYDDPDHSGGVEFGVHTHVNAPPGSGTNDTFRANEAPPSAVPNRSDIFLTGRLFPVPAVDFVGLTTNLSQMKTLSQSGGKYISASGAQGYHIVFKTDGTYDLYKVTNLQAAPNGCSNDLTQTGWGTWSIKSSGGQTLVGNYVNPANGIIFVEDNLWVDGQINTARVTVAAGRFPDNPGTRPAITVNANLLYTNKDGQDVLSLISQGDFNVGLYSADTLEVDAALVAQNGRAGRYYYSSSCGSNYVRSTLNLYGMIATNLRYGFAYTDGTGYGTRNLTYDANLLYGPPPSFPLTSDQYSVISWQEVK